MSRRRSPGRPRDPVPRERLIAIAAHAFATDGYSASSMRAIADRAGIRKSSLFHHFASKEALYEAVFDDILADLGALLAGLAADDAPWPDQLDRLGTGVVSYLGHHPDAARLLMREGVGSGPLLAGRGLQAFRSLVHATEAFLQTGIDRGAIPAVAPGQLAMSIIGLHLTWFAAAEVSATVIEPGVFDEAGIAARTAAVLPQVRRLCGLPA